MSQILPYENDNPYRRPTLKEAVAFWGYMYKKGLLSIILYFLSFVLLLVVFWWLAQGLISKYFGVDSWLILVLALPLLIMLFFQIPSIPRLYELQFKGKIKQDIPEAELKGLLLEVARKSLEIAAMVIILMCVLCVLVYGAAKYFAIPNIITLILVTATAFNTFLISLVAVSLGGYNRDFLRRTFTEEEFKRYTRLSSYKRAFTVLAAFDVLAAILLLFSISGKLTTGLVIILLVAILDNVVLAISLWNYFEIKSKNESKARVQQTKISLAVLVMVDLVFIVSFIVQKIWWTGASYENTVFVLFAIFFLSMGILGLVWLILTPIRRMLKLKQP
jgi:hypothetical protein